MRYFLMVLLFVSALVAHADPVTDAKILQLVDYVGVDYPEAVNADGSLKNPAEYQEMQEFAATIESMITELPPLPDKASLESQAKNLAKLIANKSSGESVRHHSQTLSKALRDVLKVELAPKRIPDSEHGAALYQTHCVACHGIEAKGNGPMALHLDPSPTNFHDAARVDHLSVFAFYNTITLGVNGTSMISYAKPLSNDDRWDLALYLSGLTATPEQIAHGKALWHSGDNANLTSLQAMTTLSMNEQRKTMGDNGADVLAYLRTDPAAVLEANPFTITLQWLAKSIESYAKGDAKKAYKEALSAYLDGFETAEAVIDVVDSDKRLVLEAQLGAYRTAIEHNAPLADVQQQYETLKASLIDLRERIPQAQFSNPAVFASSFIILLREGLESILIVGMLVMMLIKAERKPLLRGVHIGWISALIAGAFTWWASHKLIHISGATRELTEGITALVAAGILLYVGVWMHTKNIINDWRTYLKAKVSEHMKEEAWVGLAALSFLAVYREVFETILFYEALSLQVGPQGLDAIILGIVVAALILLVVVFMMIRFGLKLPLQQFFKISAVLIFVFAIIFVGQGIHSLEEAGKVPVWNIPFIRIDMLGIFPNLFGLGIQALIIGLALWLGFKKK